MKRGWVVLAALVAAGTVPAVAHAPSTGIVVSESAFAVRGVVHAAFGSVWNHADRMDMIGWLGQHRMNTFVYMPAEDPYTRERWREPFPAATMAHLAEEVAFGASRGVRWALGLRPGQPIFLDDPQPDICFSCEADFELLVAKYQAFHDLGARILMLSFDDVAKVSTHPEDALAFGVGDAAYGRMNAALANRLQQRFADSLVIFGPAEYSGMDRTEYRTAVAETLSPAIVVYWTGPLVGSAAITGADTDAFVDAISPADGPRRRPIIWDNYPTNDLYGEAVSAPRPARDASPEEYQHAPSTRLNFGPLKLRHADLVGRVDGLLANTMNQPHASKVALFTVAAYLNNPAAYTSAATSCPYNVAELTHAGCLAEKAWLDGIDELGGDAAAHLLDVVSQMRSTKFDRTESPGFVQRRDALVAAFGTGDWEDALSALTAEMTAERDAGRALRAGRLPSPEFLAETTNHLGALELNTTAGLLAADVLRAQRPTFETVQVARRGRAVTVTGRIRRADTAAVTARAAALAPVEAQARANPFVVHGDRVDPIELVFGTKVIVLENRMDQFLDWAHATTNAWLPLGPLVSAGPLQLTINGAPVAVNGDGTFSAHTTVVPGKDTVELVVTDAAGFRTARTFAA